MPSHIRGRRHFLQRSAALAGVGLLVGCGRVSLPWQQPTKLPRLGYLNVGQPGSGYDVLRDGLRELGYIEGQTIVIEARFAESTGQLPALAADLVGLPVDVIVAGATTPVRAAMEATRTIPIIFPNIGDPVASGFVSSLARPGGNVTGLSDQSIRLTQKRLQLLREVVPSLSRVMYLGDTAIAEVNGFIGQRELREAGQALGVQVFAPIFRQAPDLRPALDLAIAERADALLVNDTPLINVERDRIVAFATTARLPLMSQNPPFVSAGGLLSYGVNTDVLSCRAAAYVDKLLKGARASDLPVEQVTEIVCVINLKTAQALGLTIPQSVLQQATEIIQ